jgi:hypothetical protein
MSAELIEVLNWQYKVCDGKLEPSATATCFEQAIAAKPDGIVGRLSSYVDRSRQSGVQI